MKITLPKDSEKFRMDYETGYKHGYDACKKEIQEQEQQQFEEELNYLHIGETTEMAITDWYFGMEPIIQSETKLNNVSLAEDKFRQGLKHFSTDFHDPAAGNDHLNFTYSVSIDPNTFQYIGNFLLTKEDMGETIASTTGTLKLTTEWLEDTSAPELFSKIAEYVGGTMRPGM